MSSSEHAWTLENLARDLDMLVFQLEQAPPKDLERREEQRRSLRQQLETARDQLQDIAREML